MTPHCFEEFMNLRSMTFVLTPPSEFRFLPVANEMTALKVVDSAHSPVAKDLNLLLAHRFIAARSIDD